jgi:hypothetical protein
MTRVTGVGVDVIADDGGPAYPGEQGHTPGGTWNQTWNPGMTLRDWFAGQVLVGLLASEGPDFAYKGSDSVTREELVASFAYKQAEAMLAERRKP